MVNSHTVTYKSLTPADNPTQLEFNCSSHSDEYTDLNSVRLLLRIKPENTDRSYLSSAQSNTEGCVNIRLIPCLVLCLGKRQTCYSSTRQAIITLPYL